MTRPPGTRPGSMLRSRPTQLTHKGCHARAAAHRGDQQRRIAPQGPPHEEELWLTNSLTSLGESY